MGLRTKTVQAFESEWKPYTEKGTDGKDRTGVACIVTAQGPDDRGPSQYVLFTQSKKLADVLQAGQEVHGHIARYLLHYEQGRLDRLNRGEEPQGDIRWGMSAMGKENPHLTDPDGKYSHAPAPTQGAQAPQQGQQATPVAAHDYTLAELVALYDHAIAESERALSELTDEARVLSVNALFSSFVENGCKVGQTQSGAGGGMNKPMQDQLIDTIRGVLTTKGLSDLYAASSIADEALITAWQAAGGNDDAFVIAAKILLTESDDTPPPAMDAPEEDEGDSLPF